MKKALITGASRGIGAACARALAEDGYQVYVNFHQSEAAAKKLADELGGIAVQADVSDPAAVEKMFHITGPIDLLVCNAGIAFSGLFSDITPEIWRKIFAVNVDGVYNCCRCALPHMIHEKAGNIITMSSIWGVTGASCETAYSAAKAAVIGFTKALAKEVAPSGIRVNCIAPGVIDTDMNSALSAEDMAALREETPLGYIGAPADVANAVRFLASEKSGFITGQVLGVNGGFLI